MVVQWHRVLDKALRDRPVVGVADAVRTHLGRTPTRSELSAARRAAHRYAATGEAQVTTLLATIAGGHTAQVLVLAEPGVDLTDVTTLRRKVAANSRAIDKPQGQDTKDTAARVERMLSQIHAVSRSAPLLPLDQIAPAHAKLLAEDLTEALANLAVLAANLTRRSRQHPISARASGLASRDVPEIETSADVEYP